MGPCRDLPRSWRHVCARARLAETQGAAEVSFLRYVFHHLCDLGPANVAADRPRLTLLVCDTPIVIFLDDSVTPDQYREMSFGLPLVDRIRMRNALAVDAALGPARSSTALGPSGKAL